MSKVHYTVEYFDENDMLLDVSDEFLSLKEAHNEVKRLEKEDYNFVTAQIVKKTIVGEYIFQLDFEKW